MIMKTVETGKWLQQLDALRTFNWKSLAQNLELLSGQINNRVTGYVKSLY